VKSRKAKQTKQNQSHRYKEQTGGCQVGGVGGWAKQVKGTKGRNFELCARTPTADSCQCMAKTTTIL